MFINPVGGKRLGPKIYVEKVQPLFEVANVKTEVIGEFKKYLQTFFYRIRECLISENSVIDFLSV